MELGARPGPFRQVQASSSGLCPAGPSPDPGKLRRWPCFLSALNTGPCHPPLGPARWGKIQEVNKEAGGGEGGKEGGAGAGEQGRRWGMPLFGPAA